jgi:hypothetical protein
MNALIAYKTFLRLRKNVKPDPQEQRAMDDRLRLLKEQLKLAGIG